ncbi:MAG TPA: EFR1 family ferrodoxin [Candidatus Eisenbergiella merdipullorum]|uniref:EFR1 family ferrodoxin n=1 Tax=Candidatus Eisenbergiella merdipullorum TaxID=2838553 RepID=A0A9D2I4F1_9FIRM|nr:EFR1 family ferrodoxin [Candidatus Eisenbergiella merdipullorum]
MNIVQIVFSPTGGTQKVADIITGEWGKPVRKIDLSDAKTDFSAISLDQEDLAVIAVPSFGGRVPALAAQRLGELHGNGAECVAVCVYGNRAYEDTLIELNDAAVQSGFRVIAGIAAIAEHSIMHQYATGRPDAQDQEELKGFAKKILDKVSAGPADLSAPQILGNHPYKKAGGAGLVPKADHNCNGCGLCAQKCPAQAISVENPRETDSKKCISCMRCVEICPQSARKVNSAMVAVAALAIKNACSVRKDNELFC